MNKRILLSSVSIFASVALVAGATFAFFSDTETSEDNLFRAGGLDLKVDYDCYYNKEADGNPNCPWDGVLTDLAPSPLVASWTETDLGLEHKFFGFTDIKPGDFGEGTISLHVVDNDAWAWLRLSDVQDKDNSCTDPELVAEPNCAADDNGELREELLFKMWLDQGAFPGFQCSDESAKCGADEFEGDNIWQTDTEPPLITEGTIDDTGELHIAAPAFAAIHGSGTFGAGCVDVDDNGPNDGAAGTTCPGLTADGHFVGSITYYLGVDWHLPSDVGDEVQTDSLLADIAFEVEQYRHNPSPVPSPI